MDELFEDDIQLFGVDVVLNHFDGLKARRRIFSRFAISPNKPFFKRLHPAKSQSGASHLLLARLPDLARNDEPGPRFPCEAASVRNGDGKRTLRCRDKRSKVWGHPDTFAFSHFY